jgi:hypothetical protein
MKSSQLSLRQKTVLMWSGGTTNTMLDMVIRDAIDRGVLTALSSAVNMALVRPLTVAVISIYSRVRSFWRSPTHSGAPQHVLVFPRTRPKQ